MKNSGEDRATGPGSSPEFFKAFAVKPYRYEAYMLSSPDEDRRVFHTEAMLLKRVEHPNVVKVSCFVADSGTTTGFDMEQLGESLEEACSTRLRGRHALPRPLGRPARPWRISIACSWHLDIRPDLFCTSLERQRQAH